MSSTVDTNVLVYASNESDAHHEPMRRLVEDLSAGPDVVVLLWPVLLGYLRIVTHPAILPRPLGPEAAESNVTALLQRPHVRAVGERDGFMDLYLDTRVHPARGNDVPDAHLATLMRQHGIGTIWTRDRDFLRFDCIEVRNPLEH